MQRCGGRRAAPTMFRGDLLLSGASLPRCAKKCKHVTSKNSWRIQQITERKNGNIDKTGRKWNFQRSSCGIVGRFLHFLALFAPFPPARLRAQGVQQDQKDLEHGADDVDKKQPVPVRREVQTQTGAPDDKRAGEDLRELVAPERAENLRHDSGDGDAVDEQQPGIPVTDREDLRAAE